MIDHPRSNTKAPARVDAERGPQARALAAVDILVDLQVGLDRVHPAAQPVAITRHAEGRFGAQWDVEAELGIVAWSAAVDRVDLRFAKGAVCAQLRLVADVAHGAAE